MNNGDNYEDLQFENNFEESRQKKVDSFKISIDDDVLNGTASQDVPLNNSSVANLNTNNQHTSKEINSYSNKDVQRTVTREKEKEKEKARKEALKAEKKRKKEKAKKNGCLFKLMWLVMIIIVGVVLGQFLMLGLNDFLAVNRTDSNIVAVTIEKDTKISDIADMLYKNGVIKEKGFFTLYASITSSEENFSQGVFEISKNKDYEAIINFLQSDINRKDIVTIQFSEGMTVEEIAKKLSDEKVCDYKEFLKLCRSNKFDEDYDFLADIDASKRYYKLEGYLFPDTYDFYIGENAEDSVRRFLANFRTKCITDKVKIDDYDKKVNIRKQAQLKGYTLDDIIRIASLIQAEAADKKDMYLVSSVFHNRLATAETDGYSKFDEYNLYLLQSEAVFYYMEKMPKDFQKFFDTENNGGLPGGSICSPGMEAIQAALNPDDTEYYYFCHKPATEDTAAEAYYARTLDGHNENLAKLED